MKRNETKEETRERLKETFCPGESIPTANAQEALNELWEHFFPNGYVGDCMGGAQANFVIVEEIERKFPKQINKKQEKKKLEKRIENLEKEVERLTKENIQLQIDMNFLNDDFKSRHGIY
jgi:predicted RNase H-like nuclease (RuvC/YqgF family)